MKVTCESLHITKAKKGMYALHYAGLEPAAINLEGCRSIQLS